MLRVEHVNAGYGDVQVLWDVSFHVAENEFVVLVGANGAGKSTIMRAISSMVTPDEGQIWFQDQRLDLVPPHKIVEIGIAHVPEGRQLFPEMSVMENLELGSLVPAAKARRKESLEWVMELFPILKERANMHSRLLSGGEQQMLTIGRGLMAQPRMLLVDEPSLGLAPVVLDHLYETLGKLQDSKITILLSEQNALRALEIADRGYVMQDGKIMLEGKSADLLQSDVVKRAYLGR